MDIQQTQNTSANQTESEAREALSELDIDRTEQRLVAGVNLKWQGIYSSEESGSYPNLAVGGGVKAGWRFQEKSLWHAGAAVDISALQKEVTKKSVDQDLHRTEVREKEGIYVSARALIGTSSNMGDYYLKVGPSFLYDNSLESMKAGLGGDLVMGSGLYLSAGGDYFPSSDEAIGRISIGIGI